MLKSEVLWNVTLCRVSDYDVSKDIISSSGANSLRIVLILYTGSHLVFVTVTVVTVWQIPDTADTVVCAPDDGWWYHPKHVEQFPDKINCVTLHVSRSQWPRSLGRRSAASRLLRLWVRIPPGAWISVCCECCVLLCEDLCDEMIIRPEESYRLWCVVVCDLETL